MINKNIKIYSLSFILPIFFILVVLIPLQIYPFGEGSFIYWDAELQYVNYLGYFKSLFTSDNDIFYTLSSMGGTEMMDFSAYYLFSPLNFLMFLFPNEYLNIGLEFLMILRIGLCGLTFSYFLNKEFSPSYKNIFFALSYALCGYNIMYISNTIYFDGIVLLPLVILGISKIVKNEKSLLYIISLVSSIITNAYIGYVTIIFSGTFFVYKMLLSDIKEKVEIFKIIKTYVISTFLSLGLTAWLLIPVKLALIGGKYSLFSNEEELDFLFLNEPLSVIAKFYTHTFLDKCFWSETTPFIFVGILLFLLIILYFYNSGINKKEKLVTSAYITILFSTFIILPIFQIFNMGVAIPTGTIFRFAFIFEFVLIYIAYKSFLNLSFLKNDQLILAGLLFLSLSACTFFCHFQHVNNVFLLIDVILAIIFLFLIFVFNNKPEFSKCAFLLILAIHSGNIFINTNYALSSQILCHLSPETRTFTENYRGVKKALNYIDKGDKSFFRTEVTSTFTEVPEISSRLENVYMLHGYNAVSHYSTFGKIDIAKFYESIGFNTYIRNLVVNYSEQEILFPISFMGIKYIVSNNPNLSYPYEKIYEIKNYITHSKLSHYYKDIYNFTNLYVYKNNYSLPIAFSIDNTENLYKLNELNYEEIDFLNELIKIMANEDFGNIYKFEEFPIFSGVNKYNKYDKISKNAKITSTGRLYLLVRNNSNLLEYFNNFRINFNNEKETSYIEFYDLVQQTLYLGENLLGKTLNISFEQIDFIKSKSDDIKVYLVYENMENLKKYYEKLSQSPCELTKETSSYLKGKCEIKKDNQLLFMTIPYDKNWHVYVDNKKVTPQKLFGAMIGIPITKGFHNIELKFYPAGLLEGIIFSLISLILLSVFIFDKKMIFK